MGDWMTVTIEGRIDAADVPAARAVIETGEDWDKFHCLTYIPSLGGLGRWIPDGGGDIWGVGNLSERNYDADDVAEVLRQLVEAAPSLDLKVHCGGPYESKQCVATVTAHKGVVEIVDPQVETVGYGTEEQTRQRIAEMMGRNGYLE